MPLAAGKFSNPRKTFENSSASVIPFIGIRAWKDQQKGGTPRRGKWNGSSLSLPLARSPFLDKTDPHSIGGKRVFECIVEAYPSTYTKDERMTRRGWVASFDSTRGRALFRRGCGGGGGERTERGENEERERERRGGEEKKKKKKRELLER